MPLIKAELRALHAEGVAIRDRDLELLGREDLVGAIWRYLGSTPRARRLAGIPDPLRRSSEQERWDGERVIEEILDRRRAGESLAISKVPMKLVHAALRYHDTWENAITAAGLDYDAIRLKRRAASDDELLDRLGAMARARPDMTLGELHSDRDGAVIRSRFGSLATAIRKAGLTSWPARIKHVVLTRDQSIARLRAWHRAGRPLGLKVIEADDVHLALGIRRHFVTLTAAIDAARLGATPDEYVQRWSKAEVLRRIRDVARAGGSLTSVAMRDRDPKLFEAARRYFGSYVVAAKKVGYRPQQRTWSRSDVIAAIRRQASRKVST